MKRSLIKNISEYEHITSGRHSDSPGQNATSEIPHSAPPKDIPHIRADTMHELNFRYELGKTTPLEHVLRHWHNLEGGERWTGPYEKWKELVDPSQMGELGTYQQWKYAPIRITDIEPHMADPDDEVIDQYQKKYKTGSKFPAIIVKPHPEKSGKWLTVDGRHRLASARGLGHKEIDTYHPIEKSEPLRKPFKSEAQRRYFHWAAKHHKGNITTAMTSEWESATGGKHLPEKLGKEDYSKWTRKQHLNQVHKHEWAASHLVEQKNDLKLQGKSYTHLGPEWSKHIEGAKLHSKLATQKAPKNTLKKSDPLVSDEDAHSLMNRIENKYLVKREYLDQITNTLKDKLKEGDIDTSVRYNTNKTIYLDNKDLDAFRDGIDSVRPRFKVRIRQYAPNGKDWENIAYVELKIKSDDGLTRKVRVRIPASMISSILDGKEMIVDENLIEHNYDIPKDLLRRRVAVMNNVIEKYGFKKQLTVSYERRAYSNGKIRVTVDDNLKYHESESISEDTINAIRNDSSWPDYEKRVKKAKEKDFLILEVKHEDNVPGWLENLLDDIKAKEVKFSKYCAAIASQLSNGGKSDAAVLRERKIDAGSVLAQLGYETEKTPAPLRKSMAGLLAYIRDHKDGPGPHEGQPIPSDKKDKEYFKQVQMELDKPLIFSAQEQYHREHMNRAVMQKGEGGDYRKEGYKVKHKVDQHGVHEVRVFTKEGKKVGRFVFAKTKNQIEPMWSTVEPEHRRKGIASGVYKFMERKTGLKMKPADTQTEFAEKLWEQPNRQFGLKKSFHPKNFNRIKAKQDPEGPETVDSSAHLEQHRPDPAYVNFANAEKEHKGEGVRQFGGISANMVHKIPRSGVPGDEDTYMAKPYHKKIESGTRYYVKHPILGWATMATKKLLHAAGMGDMTEDVSVHKHKGVPMTVHKFESGYSPLNEVKGGASNAYVDPLDQQKITAMDFLTGNLDRHYGNLLLGEAKDMNRGYSHQPLLIDHERNFQYIQPIKGQTYASRGIRNNLYGQRLASHGSALAMLRQDNIGPEEFHDWWKGNSPSILKAFNEEIEHIKNPKIKDHIKNNFLSRMNYIHDWSNKMDQGDYSDIFNKDYPAAHMVRQPLQRNTIKGILEKLPMHNKILSAQTLDRAMSSKRSEQPHTHLMYAWKGILSQMSPQELGDYLASKPNRNPQHEDKGALSELLNHVIDHRPDAIPEILKHEDKLPPYWVEHLKEKMKNAG